MLDHHVSGAQIGRQGLKESLQGIETPGGGADGHHIAVELARASVRAMRLLGFDHLRHDGFLWLLRGRVADAPAYAGSA